MTIDPRNLHRETILDSLSITDNPHAFEAVYVELVDGDPWATIEVSNLAWVEQLRKSPRFLQVRETLTAYACDFTTPAGFEKLATVCHVGIGTMAGDQVVAADQATVKANLAAAEEVAS